VLLARDASVGVALRRGPSKRVCTVLWNRRKDEFRVGQWLNGRIYERRCDLSPDGKYLIYFAMNGRWQSEAKGSWTAISKAPYLKAVAMFPKGDCWNGGGLFTDNTKYWLNDGCGHAELRNTSEVHRDKKFQPSQYFGGECLSVYYPRLMRDGWTYLGRQKVSNRSNIDVFEKPLREGWFLRKLAHAGKRSASRQRRLLGPTRIVPSCIRHTDQIPGMGVGRTRPQPPRLVDGGKALRRTPQTKRHLRRT